MAPLITPRRISISNTDVAGGLDECCEMLGGPVGRKLHVLEARGPSPHYSSQAWLVPGVTINKVNASQMGIMGSRSLDGRDDLYLNLPLDDFAYRLTQAGREVIVGKGGAATSLSAEAYTVTSGEITTPSGNGKALTLLIARELLRDLVDNEDRMVAGHILPSTPALPLLISYLTTLNRIEEALPEALTATVQRHVAELVAMALGPTSQARETAREGALREARLAHAKDYIAQSLSNPQLSDANISAFLGASVSSIRKDFERSGLSLARYIREERIKKAAGLLSDPRAAGQKIIDIALSCGFSDISTFNRAFARQFGCSPRDFRIAANGGVPQS